MPDDYAPELLLPFTFSSKGADEIDQSSDTAIQQEVLIVLSYELGQRLDLPEFGIPDQLFRKGGANFDEIQEAILEWAPDAREIIESNTDWLASLVQTIQIRRDNA